MRIGKQNLSNNISIKDIDFDSFEDDYIDPIEIMPNESFEEDLEDDLEDDDVEELDFNSFN